MEFTRELARFLQGKGYGLLTGNQSNLWGRKSEEGWKLIYLIPQPLAGQPQRKLGDVMREEEAIGRQYMIQSGLRVEWLTLMVCPDFPDVHRRQEIEAYSNIWCLNRAADQLLIYENQPGEFDGFRADLEEFMMDCDSRIQKEHKKDFFAIVTPVNTGLILINCLVFIVLSLLGDVTDPNFMAKHGALDWPDLMLRGEYYRLFTSMFLHFGLDHLAQNMLMLFLIGNRLEKMLGKIPYLILYLASGLVAAGASVYFTLQADHYIVSAGASGAIFGVLGGILGLLVKDMVSGNRKRIQNLGLRSILFMVLIALSYGFLESGVDNAAHLGGLLGGFVLAMVIALFTDGKIRTQ